MTRHADQRALLGDPRASADTDSPGYPPKADEDGGDSKFGFIMPDDPEHARLRRMVTAPFAVKRVEALRPVVQGIVDGLVDELLAGPRPVDLVEAFALPIPSLVICELLGVPYGDHAFFQENTKTMVHRDATPEQRGRRPGRSPVTSAGSSASGSPIHGTTCCPASPGASAPVRSTGGWPRRWRCCCSW